MPQKVDSDNVCSYSIARSSSTILRGREKIKNCYCVISKKILFVPVVSVMNLSQWNSAES